MSEDIKAEQMQLLKEKADMMGIKYSPNIGLETLRKKINDKLSGSDESEEEVVVPVIKAKENQVAKIKRIKNEAAKLVRIRVTNMDPNQKDFPGDWFDVGNSTIGVFRKYVPFDTEEGWHVPHIIYETIKSKKCQIFKKIKLPNGQSSVKGMLINKYAVEILPNLTPKELEDLAQRQAMSGNID